MPDPPLLGRVLPQFAGELEAALAQESPDLASQVHRLAIGRRCPCGERGCATFEVPGGGPGDYDFTMEVEQLHRRRQVRPDQPETGPAR